MSLFDAYIMVDWSGGNSRRLGKPDCIWIAYGPASASSPETVSSPSRSEAEQIIRSQLQTIVGSNKGRVLVCADFGYGYPAGFASLLQLPAGNGLPPWRIVWKYLTDQLQDDLGTKTGHKPTNCSNRFEVANAINAAASGPGSRGPFWGLCKPGEYACVPQKRPPQPFVCATGKIASLRITDRRAKSDTPFRLFGTGSVGSQVLTGIPRLQNIRFDPWFARCSAVWPFETGWAPATGSWLDPNVRVLHAEIYPSLNKERLTDAIKDRGQVRAMWRWARDLDAKNLLIKQFAVPPGITSGSQDDIVICREEGWILGCPP
jgi:precorrin-8X/cobalt-precorrin-8 methylmutase